jgi:hypothetical protein
MHKVLVTILPRQSIDAIFGEVFRHLTRSLDELAGGMQISSKFGRKRLKVDMTLLQKNISNMKLENEDIVGLLVTKIKSILVAKAGEKEEEP